jgi:hypothetical protein
MNLSDVRRNALALALVIAAANLASSLVLLHETHKLRQQAEVCLNNAQHGAPNAPPSPPRIGSRS